MTVPYNEIAALLIAGSATVGPDADSYPEEAADAIIATLSLTLLHEYVRLHLTIDAAQDWATDSEKKLCSSVDLARGQREEAAGLC